MFYREFAPPPELMPYVDAFWSGRSDIVPANSRQMIAADGTAALVFAFGGLYRYATCTGAHAAGETAIIIGQRTRPGEVLFEDVHKAFGVRFRPGGISAFMRMPVIELCDSLFTLETIFPGLGDLPFRLAEAPGDFERVRILSHALRSRLHADRGAAIRHAVSYLIRHRGAPAIDEVGRLLGMGYRALDRSFARVVGIPPKLLARQIRLLCMLQAYRQSPKEGWVSLAIDHHYSDQAHLIRDFREFLGTTPGRFGSADTALERIIVNGSLPGKLDSL